MTFSEFIKTYNIVIFDQNSVLMEMGEVHHLMEKGNGHFYQYNQDSMEFESGMVEIPMEREINTIRISK